MKTHEPIAKLPLFLSSPPSGSVIKSLAVVFLYTTFFPYLAIPVGQSTNLPISSVLGFVLILSSIQYLTVVRNYIVLLAFPPVSAVTGWFFLAQNEQGVSGLLTWAAYIVPFPAGIAVLFLLGHKIRLHLQNAVILTSAFAWFQFEMFKRGSIPFQTFYNMPGYASMASNPETVLLFIRRPFAQFPEPSMMAGTLALALIFLLVLNISLGEPVTKVETLTVVLSSAVLVLSSSGSAVFTIPVIALMFGARFISEGKRRLLVLPLLISIGVLLATVILGTRNVSSNWSWTVRFENLLAGWYLLRADLGYLLIGVGRGRVTSLYSSGAVESFSDFSVQVALDIPSVLGRIILEGGLMFGLPIVLYFLFRAVSPVNGVSRILILLAGGTWFLVAFVAITYETAAWIWLFPGLIYGLSLARWSPRGETLRGSQQASQRILQQEGGSFSASGKLAE
jgi:hypothetical protein